MLGEAICDLTYQLISEWSIPLSKVQYVITDNGSNMVKAFKLAQVTAMTKDKDHEEQSDDEVEFEDNDLEEEEQDPSGVIDNEIAEFEREEACHSEVFTNKGLKRLSCFSHTLQLVVTAFNKDDSAKALLSKAYKVVSSVSKSGKATEALVATAGKKLVSHSMTRWTSAYLVVERLLEVMEPLGLVLLQNNMTMLQPEEWEALGHVKTLLSKFATYTNVAGGEQYATLSLIVPYYVELRHHLGDMKKIDAVGKVADILLSELERRFGKLLDSSDKDHDPIYMIATLLDPR